MSRSTILVLFLLSLLAAALLLASRSGAHGFAGGPIPAVPAAAAIDAPAAPEGTREPVAAESARGCWSAPAGSWFRFRVHDHTTCVVRGADGTVHTSVELRAACDLTTTVLDRRDGELLLRQQIEGLSFLGADGRALPVDAEQQGFVAAVASPLLVRMGADGRNRSYGFAADLDREQRNFVRGMLDLFQFEAPRAGGATWESSLADTTGTCEVRYECLPAEADRIDVRRTRIRYTAIGDENEVPAHELSGAARARFDVRRGWLSGVQLDEEMKLALGLLDMSAFMHRDAEALMVDSGTSAIDLDVAAAWVQAEHPASEGVVPAAPPGGGLRGEWARRLQGVTLEALLVELAQPGIGVDAQNDLFQQLQWMVKLDESAARELQSRLMTRQLGDVASQVAVGALGAAGTVPAQQVLVALRADATIDTPLRTATTIACVQLAQPLPELITGLCEGAAAGELQGTTMLVLGALAPRASEQRIRDRSPLEVLLAMEPDAEARGELDTWVLAVGNTRDPQVLAIAQRLLDHRSPAVRGACCAVLRDVAGALALATLIERGLGDPDAGVRTESVSALSRRSEPAARDALVRVAQSDPDAAVRERARRILGGNE